MPNAIELSRTDMNVLIDSLDYCQSNFPDTFSCDMLRPIRELENELEPIVIVGDEARLVIGALSLASEDRSVVGDNATDVIEQYRTALKYKVNFSTLA